MKITAISLLLALLSCSIVFSFCKKDPSTKELLSSASCWKITKQESKLHSESVWTNNSIEATISDDCYRYFKNGDYVSTSTNPAPVFQFTSTWKLKGEGGSEYLVLSGLADVFDIEQISSETLVLVLHHRAGSIRTTYSSN
jgi:hypothetical protein